jgi:tRNA (guanine-N7-)-methyltransferase
VELASRTFKPRRRALSLGRQADFDRLAPQWCLAETGPVVGLDGAVLDIGFGDGAATVELALVDPARLVVGADVHTPGVVNVLVGADRHGLTNVRVVHGDALVFLDRVAHDALAGVRVLFPDPWPKQRQRHRRMVRTDVVAEVVRRLAPGGWLELATDDAGYAAQMRQVCDAHGELTGGVVARPGRAITKFERQALDAGRTVTDLRYRREPAR